MSDREDLVEVQVIVRQEDADAELLDEVTSRLQGQLLGLDVEEVRRPRGALPPEDAKVADPLAIGALAVTLVKNAKQLGSLLRMVRGWVANDKHRSVEIEIDGQRLTLASASDADQERLVDAFIEHVLK
jgi:hypothetical protein